MPLTPTASQPAKPSTAIILKGFALTAVAFVTVSIINYLFKLFGGTGLSFPVLFSISRLLFWLCLLIVYLYVTRQEKQPFLIWPEREYGVWFYIASVVSIIVVIFIGMMPISFLLRHFGLLRESAVMNDIMRLNWPIRILACVTAGVVEEAIFRGYLMTRLQLFFKQSHWPIVISSVIFGLMHLRYGTVVNVVGPIFIGLIFALHYNKYRNIKVLMFSHFLWDLLVFIIHK